jgi:hypothetical protein
VGCRAGSYQENLVRGEPVMQRDLGIADPSRRAHSQSPTTQGAAYSSRNLKFESTTNIEGRRHWPHPELGRQHLVGSRSSIMRS